MPVVNVTPAELFTAAITQARTASKIIMQLSSPPLHEGESLDDRVTEISYHAVALAEAFLVIDGIAREFPDLSSSTPQPTERRGVSREDVN